MTEKMTETKYPAFPTLYCDLCNQRGALLTPAKYDGKTKIGPWAFMCDECFSKWGVGLGIGKGQKIKEQDDE